MLHKSLVAKVDGPEKAADWFHERAHRRAEQSVSLGQTFPRGAEWDLAGCQECSWSASSGPFKPFCEQRSWFAVEAGRPPLPPSCASVYLFIPLLLSGFRASCLPGKPEMQRRGPALILLEEAVEGQLPDGPVVRSSRVFQLGACGMP